MLTRSGCHAAVGDPGSRSKEGTWVDREPITAKPIPNVVCNGITRCVESPYRLQPLGGVRYAAGLWYKLAGTDDMVNSTIETYSTSSESSCKLIGTSKYTCSAAGTKLGFKNS